MDVVPGWPISSSIHHHSSIIKQPQHVLLPPAGARRSRTQLQARIAAVKGRNAEAERRTRDAGAEAGAVEAELLAARSRREALRKCVTAAAATVPPPSHLPHLPTK